MPRKGESIFRRKDGRWEARYIKGYKKDGTKIYGSVYAKTYTDVKNKRLDILKKVDYNHLITPTEHLEFYIHHWFENNKRNLKESTLTKYDNSLKNYIIPYFRKIKIEDITIQKINDFIFNLMTIKRTRGKPLSTKTIKDTLLILKNIFKYIEINYDIKINAVIIPPKQSFNNKVSVFSKSDIYNLLMIIYTDMESDLCKLGTFIALMTGMRVGEICALKWENINLNENYIYIEKTMQRVKNFDDNKPKTKIIETSPKSHSSLRKIPISDYLYRILIKYKKNNDHYLLTGRSDKFIEPRLLEKKFKKYIKSAEIEDGNFHMLRHTFATLCVENNLNIKVLSQILGHSNIQITLDRYTHPDYETKNIFMNQASEIFLKSIDIR